MKTQALSSSRFRSFFVWPLLVFLFFAVQSAFSQTVSGSNLSIGGTNNTFLRNASGAFGLGNTLRSNCLSIGSGNILTGSNSEAIGDNNNIESCYSLIVGGRNTCSYDGYDNCAYGVFILGFGNDLNGYCLTVNGVENSGMGTINMINGIYNSFGNSDSVGWLDGPTDSLLNGYFNRVISGESCFVSGENNILFSADLDNCTSDSAAIGRGLIVTSSQHIAVGLYNTQYATGVEPVFTVANGTSSDARHDALVVRKDSTTQVNGSLIVTGTMSGNVVVAGTNQLVLIPQQGDLSMGTFINGTKPQ